MWFIRMKTYPLSSKLTGLNGSLLCLDIFVSFAITFVILLIIGEPGDYSNMEMGIAVVTGLVFFIIVHILINKITDKKYEVVLQEYNELCSKLTNENPRDVKDKMLTTPANIAFTRLAVREGRLVKLKYFINGTGDEFKNGETINITTDKALNTIAINKKSTDLQYFTVKDGEQITIEYAMKILKNVKRS
ncbi:MAG: hypothetical protein ACK5L6_11040 [Anaerorhabdus sp.]|uniref:hypothetical protein n=1 Tax=Anaerorhabdus sp. TaxID=1872524 RepID=UPI003A87B42D